jgi:hypothetical protein
LALVGARAETGVFSSNNATTGGSSMWSSTLTGYNGGAANFRQFSNATTIFWEAWKNNRAISVRCLKD